MSRKPGILIVTDRETGREVTLRYDDPPTPEQEAEARRVQGGPRPRDDFDDAEQNR